MRRIIGIAVIVPWVFILRGAIGVTWHVDGSVPQSGDGTSWQTAFKAIQEGIDASSNGDTVIVAEGTYLENVKFNGKNIVLTSTNPLDPNTVAATIIDGGGAGSVVAFAGTENEACVLSGFTIRNGSCGVDGGDWYTHTHATIENNMITGNRAWGLWGGGIAYCDGVIDRNAIYANRAAKFGGGLYACNGVIRYNDVHDNSVDEVGGGGLSSCTGTIERNRISDNTATSGNGGGLYDCDGTVRNNIISGNSAKRYGGGLYGCSGAVENNTVYGNSTGEHGGALASCRGVIVNCIIWGNKDAQASQLYDCSQPTYSCIEGWVAGGEGNIWFHPYFVDVDNADFHLKSCSPCIDGGDPQSPFSDEPEPNGGRVDMGAYGNTPEATPGSPDAEHDSLPDDWEVEFFGELIQGPADDADGDFVSNFDEYLRGYAPATPPAAWYVHGAVSSSGDGKSWETAFKTIQEGMDAASAGDRIVVAPGTYIENIRFKGKVVALRSTDPLDPGVVANTIIDGNRSGSTVTFAGTECEGCLLAGFTIRNGGRDMEIWGGGVCGGTGNTHTHATIRNNVITGNSAGGTDRYYPGGGLCWCDGVIEGNRITGNTAGGSGGGLAECNGIIMENEVSDNSANADGGGLYRCNANIHDNVITRNSSKGSFAPGGGGGLALCQGLIEANTISDNTASSGGGLYRCDRVISNNLITGNGASWGGGLAHCDGVIEENLIWRNSACLYDCDGTIQRNTIVNNTDGVEECDGTIQNNIISGNYIDKGGGGLAYCDGIIQNNTITSNSGYAAGLYYCSATVFNCIIWGNSSGGYRGQVYLSAVPTYSCIQDWTEGGEGNISGDPLFVDPDGPDDNPRTYEDNNYRLLPDSPCVDSGESALLVPAGLDMDGNLRIAFGGQSLTVDMGAYEFNSVPFAATEIVRDESGGLRLTWTSQPNDIYTVWSCDDLSEPQWIQAGTVPSQGAETILRDQLLGGASNFYRVQMR